MDDQWVNSRTQAEMEAQMSSIDVSEKDLEVVTCAALECASIGDMDDARALDKLARKIHLALCRDRATSKAVRKAGCGGNCLSWKDVPSVL